MHHIAVGTRHTYQYGTALFCVPAENAGTLHEVGKVPWLSIQFNWPPKLDAAHGSLCRGSFGLLEMNASKAKW